MLKHITRGSDVLFSCTFDNPDNPGEAPGEASINIDFPTVNGARGQTTISLSYDDGVWRGSWDSSAAEKDGAVHYWARCSGGFKAATQGTFILDANSANRGE